MIPSELNEMKFDLLLLYLMVKIALPYTFSCLDTTPECDRQTDGRTITPIAITLCIIQGGPN